ncbi:MAG: NERD domain-containing protein [Alkalibacterium sp.]|nr:NERD domain-containing protein [Alkalibacterium sp.]
MIIKERTKSSNHSILESLNNRMTLSFSEKSQFENQVKGYEGEQLFDTYIKDSPVNGLVINDLLLKSRDTHYQIDSLVITENHIYLYEVKNYSGSYEYKAGSIFSESGHVLQSPTAQAERKKGYLYNLLLKLGQKAEISTYVIYINPEFYIYSLPPDPSIIFAGQVSNHLKDLINQTKPFSDRELSLGHKLVNLNDDAFRPSNLPEYTFNQLKKGILCPYCFSFEYTNSRQCRICSSCGYQEKTAEAIHRSIEEFRLLFPDNHITKQLIYIWCGSVWSKSRIQDVLNFHYQTHHAGRGTYYS